MEKSRTGAIRRQILITVICVGLNLAGGQFAAHHVIPLWMDSIGTVFAAYTLGPVCGAMVGAGSNVISSILFDTWIVYALTSVAIGVITGLAARKGVLNSFFGTMCLATGLTVAALAVSLPLNALTTGGMTGNVWGDAVIDYLADRGFGVIRFLLGQYYVEFVDKTGLVLLLAGTVQLWRRFRARRRRRQRRGGAAALLLALSILAASLAAARPALARTAREGGSASARAGEKYGDYIATVYDNTNGLPCGEANTLACTNDGAVWVGTYAGLYRYTGQKFVHMDDFGTVKNVNCLYADVEGRLWIGTNDSGLAIAIDENVANTITQEDGLPADAVRSVGGGQNGLYYVGTSGGLALVTLEGGLHMVRTFPEVTGVISIDTDEAGHAVCVSGDGRLYLFTGDTLRETRDAPEGAYTAVRFDRDGSLLAGTDENTLQTFAVSDEGLKLQREKTLEGIKQINDIFIAQDTEDVFVCTDTGIGYVDSDGSFHRMESGEFTASVEEMTQDYQGNFWFASSRLGLLRLTSSGVVDLFAQAGLPESVVNAVTRWNGDLYCGTDEGLVVLDAKNKVKASPLVDALDGVRIRCLYAQDENNLWISTDGKGTALASKKGEVTYFDEEGGAFGDKSRVVTGFDGGVIAAGSGGLSYFKDGRLTRTIRTAEGAARILCLSVLSDGTILAGTDGDGVTVIREGRIDGHLTKEDGLSSDIVLKLPVNGEDVYAVTSNGLCYLSDDDTFTALTGFPYFNNYDICFSDSGKAFVSGSAGIYVVDADSLKANDPDMAWQLLDADWGFSSSLTANAWNWLDDEGNYCLSTSRGVYSFSLRDYDTDYRSYRISISKAWVDGTEYSLEKGTPFTLEQDAEKLTLRPEIINFTVENPTITYQLVGYDRQAVRMRLSELSEVTYSNLPSGSYTFVLSVLSRDRVSVAERAQAVFVREQMLWEKTYFIIYFFGIAAATIAWLTWLAFRTHVEQVLKMQKQQVEMAREQVRMSNETILTIARTLDTRDSNTSMHSERVAEYSVKIAEKLGFSDAECENLHKVALLHDIGKIGIPDAILNKPSRLTDEEYAAMKTHVTKGAEILRNFTGIDHVVEGALYHHERYDGRGYANGLKGEEIPLYGRIISVADAFDAMTADRVYRKHLDLDHVLGEMERCSGTQFDPEIAKIMIALVKSGEIDVEQTHHRDRKEDTQQ